MKEEIEPTCELPMAINMENIQSLVSFVNDVLQMNKAYENLQNDNRELYSRFLDENLRCRKLEQDCATIEREFQRVLAQKNDLEKQLKDIQDGNIKK